MRKFAFVSVLLLTFAVLTGCAVSQEEKDACEDHGGLIQEERFLYSSQGLFGSDIRTGRLSFCEQNGQITKVYNEEIKSADGGFFGPNANNRRVFDECTAVEGRVYRTSVTAGKTSHTYWACVKGGQYTQILE